MFAFEHNMIHCKILFELIYDTEINLEKNIYEKNISY